MSALNATYPISNTTVSTGGVAALYHQCGGINWTGPTECEAGAYCKDQNDFYHQCVAVEGAYTNATATGSNADYINTLLASGPASARPTTLVTITASSSAAATPTSTADDEDDYCEDEEPVTASVSSRPTPSAAAASDEDDYCEEETVTVSVSAKPTATAAAASEEDDYCEDEQ
ncbi:hypothetical protein SLS64_008613 [Diaporthe eres]|uniref:CBM1 domain-containing protein n=1 Tax=Diaporthe eres TaxID=83184 RepID=A0ABR1NNN1_DIAER